jgi:endonuclease/exonuclease/phosphatase family metal-dependent hydrolase
MNCIVLALLLSATVAQAELPAQPCEALLRAFTPQILTVSTWNLNFLNRKYNLGPFELIHVQEPLYTERAERLGAWLYAFLNSPQAPSVLMMQEIWPERENQTLTRIAHELNYQVVETRSDWQYRHGLQMLIKRSLGHIEETGFVEFPKTRNNPRFEWAGRVKRGALYAKVELPDGQKVWIGTTHLTPFARFVEARANQVDVLHEYLRDLSPEIDHVIIGGDFNIASEFSGDDELKNGQWLYSHLAQTTGLRDTFRAHEPDAPGFTFNTHYPRPKLVGGPAEAEQRLDYIFAGERNEQVRLEVRNSALLFKEPLDGIYPSDHFMVQSELELSRRAKP